MLIGWLSFHFSVDVWSVGCIMAEMVRGSVLFPGSDRILKLNPTPLFPEPVVVSLCLSDILFKPSAHKDDLCVCLMRRFNQESKTDGIQSLSVGLTADVINSPIVGLFFFLLPCRDSGSRDASTVDVLDVKIHCKCFKVN